MSLKENSNKLQGTEFKNLKQNLTSCPFHAFTEHVKQTPFSNFDGKVNSTSTLDMRHY